MQTGKHVTFNYKAYKETKLWTTTNLLAAINTIAFKKAFVSIRMGLGMKKSLIHHLGYPNTVAWKCYSKEWSWPSNTTSMMIAQLWYLQKGSKYMQFTSYKYPLLRVHIYICQHFLSSHLAFMSDGNRFFLWKTDIHNDNSIFSYFYSQEINGQIHLPMMYTVQWQWIMVEMAGFLSFMNIKNLVIF